MGFLFFCNSSCREWGTIQTEVLPTLGLFLCISMGQACNIKTLPKFFKKKSQSNRVTMGGVCFILHACPVENLSTLLIVGRRLKIQFRLKKTELPLSPSEYWVWETTVLTLGGRNEKHILLWYQPTCFVLWISFSVCMTCNVSCFGDGVFGSDGWTHYANCSHFYSTFTTYCF